MVVNTNTDAYVSGAIDRFILQLVSRISARLGIATNI